MSRIASSNSSSTEPKNGPSTPRDDRVLIFSNQLLRIAIDAWTRQLTSDGTPGGAVAAWVRGQSQTLSPDWKVPLEIPEENDVEHLRWLLVQTEHRNLRTSSSTFPSDEGLLLPVSGDVSEVHWDHLIAAIHSALSLVSTHGSFRVAVESSATRQVYNLAYGLTHEINNPLANILARAQQLIPGAPSESDRKSLATIVDQASRAHEMLSEVMRAVQPPPLRLGIAEVIPLVLVAFQNLQSDAERLHVQWELKHPNTPLFARIDRDALTEVLRLIGRNALDVCRPRDSVVWSISDSAKPSMEHPSDASSRSIVISICDTGPGLSPTAAKSAFDLFYSGREHGRGLGISLAVVRRVLDAHGGQVRLRSEQGAGCIVEIELPASDPPPRTRPFVPY